MINDYEATVPIVPEASRGDADTDKNAETISTLNNLIETCRDGQYGFKTASESVERSDLKTVFEEFSQQRANFASVLQELVRSAGGDPETGGSVSGAVHRGWIDINSAVASQSEDAVLNECERGEDYAKDAYAEALKADLPGDIAGVVSQQSQAILAAHNRIKSLRDVEAHKSASTGS